MPKLVDPPLPLTPEELAGYRTTALLEVFLQHRPLHPGGACESCMPIIQEIDRRLPPRVPRVNN